MSSEVFETDIVAATTTHDDAMRAAEEPKKGLWLTRGLLLAGWMCSLLLVVVLAALLFSGKLYGTAATSAGSEEDLRPGGAAPAGRPFSPPTQWPMDAGATCLQGRSQALHGSGQAICHQGAGVPTSDFMDSPLPGDGACAFCMAGARADEPEQCIACHEGFLLHVTNAEKCTGRCVPADQQEPVALPEEVCTAPTDTAACAMHGDPLLCYDNRVTCHYRIEWDDGMCDGRMGKWCQATCQACEGPSPDTHLEGLLLQWKQTLSLGPSSPLRWGWQADIPVNRWPGVLVEEPASGGFLRELHLAEFDLHGPLFPAWGTFYHPESGMAWNLRHNHLTGTLPPEWGMALHHLAHLDLSNNQLEGTIPVAWSQGREGGQAAGAGDSGHGEWFTLDLGSNRLSGHLKPEWFSDGLMRRVVSLTLENNMFQGSLPAEWSRLHIDLERLNVRNNSLTNKLPAQYSVFSNIYYLLLGENSLSGTLPA
eukprot:CAMPEP_0117662770 /NCGR_PEP_ID=MMETSP0804-20121206/8227_1 /TAXON_ID=1074897 /ORGANISM="Tetraselmis astigmatica, Strain CCMP880" /LENGTH=479 /DNA_ID=CAMNT_0005469685 /DNA_START=371 /DNA_END=1807 /DNA_ORIENTATION=+